MLAESLSTCGGSEAPHLSRYKTLIGMGGSHRCVVAVAFCGSGGTCEGAEGESSLGL